MRTFILTLCIIIFLIVQGHEGRTIKKVIVVTRHGDRAPAMLFPNPKVYNPEFTCETPTSVQISPLFNQINSPLFEVNLRTDGGQLNGNCMMGKLTKRGMNQHLMLGTAFFDRYKSLISNMSDIYVESTDVPRTIKSAMHNLIGLLGMEAGKSSYPVRNIVVAEHKISDMEVNWWSSDAPCPLLKSVLDDIRAEEDWIKWYDDNVELRKELATIFKLDKPAEVYPIFDNMNCVYAFNVTKPEGYTDEIHKRVHEYVEWEYNYIFKNPRMASYGIGHFLGRLVKALSDDNKHSYNYYSGHDMTIGPLLVAMTNGNMPFWPPYASNIEIELYDDNTVRTLFQLNPITVRGCNGEEYCPLENFLNGMAEVVPTDWKEKCHSVPSFTTTVFR